MRKTLLLFFMLIHGIQVFSQTIPSEWRAYESPEYLYNIQSDYKPDHLSVTEFSTYLLDIARTELAKTINLKVNDVASIDKSSENGKSSISYMAKTTFSTEAQINLVHAKSRYDENENTVSVLIYIDKEEALEYELSNTLGLLSTTDRHIHTAHEYFDSGFKNKAENELASAIDRLDQVDYSLNMLNVLGLDAQSLEVLRVQSNNSNQKIKVLQIELQHAVTIHITGSADFLGSPYNSFENLVKGHLSDAGCNFTTERSSADWVITLNAFAEEYNSNTVGNSVFYYSYAIADVTIDKNRTGQRIYEDSIRVKGGATIGYRQAAQKAYENLAKELGIIIKQNINL